MKKTIKIVIKTLLGVAIFPHVGKSWANILGLESDVMAILVLLFAFCGTLGVIQLLTWLFRD